MNKITALGGARRLAMMNVVLCAMINIVLERATGAGWVQGTDELQEQQAGLCF